MKLHDMLNRGYFPKELPRPFVTASFASAATSGSQLTGAFAAKQFPKPKSFRSSKPVRYSLARGALLRRPLSIPNPLHYYHLCDEITKHWSDLSLHLAGNTLSATSPTPAIRRAIDGKHPQSDRSRLAQNTRLGRRYVLQTDITRFYHSIYTHSIPWAIHTKVTAKTVRGFQLLGNRLDFLVRMGQDGQTVGIPVGPDTSLVLAELIMQKCDAILLNSLSGLKGHRYIDDYELSFDTRTEAEDAFHLLEACLTEYELALNPKKTQIYDLPLPLEAAWATELKRLSFGRTTSAQASDLEGYFNKAFSLHSAYPGDSVLQFAIARLRSLKVDPLNWELLQRLLLLCVIPEPATFPYVLEQIILRVNAGATPMRAELIEIVNRLVCRHSPLKHSSEVANSLWACLALGLPLEVSACDAVSKCDDPVVALLALDCEASKLVGSPLDKGLWSGQMTEEGLYDEFWLLAYEANVKGWLPSAGSQDHVAADATFGALKKRNVEFYDRSLASQPYKQGVPLPTLPTISAFGSLLSP